MVRGEKKRKTRCDKKKQIAPYIEDKHRVWIYRIARFVEQPEGEVGIRLVQAALYDEECIRFFSSYFKRPYFFTDSHLINGRMDAPSIEEYIQTSSNRGRFKIKATQEIYRQLFEFQIALGTPYLAHAVHALLKYALHDLRIIRKVAPGIEAWNIHETIKPTVKTLNQSSAWSILK
jgi:hypothetical protein